MWELTAKLEQLPAGEFATYPGELEAGGFPVFLASPVGFKPWIEDQGNVGKEGGHIYDCIKMLYQDFNQSLC